MDRQTHPTFDAMPLPKVLTLLVQPDRYGTLADPDLERLTYAAMQLYGRTNGPGVVEQLMPLLSLYQSRVPYERLSALYEALLADVRVGRLSHHALEPFLFCSALFLVCRAARDASSACPLEDGDPLTGPRAILEAFRQNPADIRRPWLFGGLLMLGDRRVTRLLWDARNELTLPELEVVTELRSPYMYAALVDFWLEWLEGLVDSSRDRRLDLVARALENVAWHGAVQTVIDIRRDFPLPQSDNPVAVLGNWSVETYTKAIAPRLQALAARKPDVLKQVLQAWGVAMPNE